MSLVKKIHSWCIVKGDSISQFCANFEESIEGIERVLKNRQKTGQTKYFRRLFLRYSTLTPAL